MTISLNEFIEIKNLIESTNGTVVMSFGRMNPPSRGHLLLMNKIIKIAKEHNGTPLLFLSHSEDKKKNPLSYNEKYEIVKKEAPAGLTVVKSSAKTIIDAMKAAVKLSGKNLIVVVGSDRVNDIKRFEKYKDEIGCESYTVVSAGERDPDSDGVQGISGTKLRNSAVNNDFETFKKGIITKNLKLAKNIFDMIRDKML